MLIEPTSSGLYCAAGGLHVDPWEPVDRAVITPARVPRRLRWRRDQTAPEADTLAPLRGLLP